MTTIKFKYLAINKSGDIFQEIFSLRDIESGYFKTWMVSNGALFDEISSIKKLQYTGFEDKNNNPIFDNDIFRCSGAVYKLVRHRGGCYELHEVGNDKVFFLFNHHNLIEIIGNEFQNPELLESK